MVVEKEKKPPTLDDMLADGIIVRGDDESLVVRRQATGIPQIDEMLTGGFPFGRETLIVGPESTGKTLLSQYVAAAVQRDDPAAQVLLLDLEHSYTNEWWAGTGVDVSRMLVARPHTGELATDVVKAALSTRPEIKVVIIDSIATMTPAPEMNQATADQSRAMGGLARVVNNLYHQVVPLNKHAIFIAINQIRDSMSPYGEEVYPGGAGQKFWSHLRLRTRRDEWLTENKKRVGFVMEVVAVKNKTSEPYASAKLPFYFRGLIDMMSSYMDDAINKGIIQQAGSWYTWGEDRWQGKTSMRDWFSEHPEKFEELRKVCGE